MPDTFEIVPIEKYELRRKMQDGDQVLIQRVGVFDKRAQAEKFRDQLIQMDTNFDAKEFAEP